MSFLGMRKKWMWDLDNITIHYGEPSSTALPHHCSSSTHRITKYSKCSVGATGLIPGTWEHTECLTVPGISSIARESYVGISKVLAPLLERCHVTKRTDRRTDGRRQGRKKS